MGNEQTKVDVLAVMVELGAVSDTTVTLRDLLESWGIARGHMFQRARVARETDKASTHRRWRVQEALICRRQASVLRQAVADFERGHFA